MKRKIFCFIVIILILSMLPIVQVSASTGDWIAIEDKEPVKDYAYSFVAIGDTQILSYSDATQGTNYMSQLYDWIVANKEEKKIEYVFGLGDITDQDWLATGKDEWANATENIYKLNGVVPYSMVRGNHDGMGFYNKAFDIPEYKDQFGGFYKDNIANSWRTINICGTDYLMITLDHGATDDLLEWAGKKISEYPDHRVIITVHWYLAADGSPGDIEDYGPAKPVIKNHGTEIWQKLIKKHSNIFMVMCGHVGVNDIVKSQRPNPAGGKVTQVLIDPQNYDDSNSPAGMIGIFYFSEDGKRIDVEYFSTVKNMYFKEKNQFTISIPIMFQPKLETVPLTEAVTSAPATEEPATSATEAEEKGCKVSVCSAMAAASLAVLCSALLVRKKRKE